ncbi:MAG: 30S ribosomal protein S8 [Nitrospinae bacterium]|nr:30S ribosomal protein S8 [Nitrospinota bacterium]
MNITDPVADMLTRIRNAVMARHDKLSLPSSGLKAELAAVLRQEGYIRGFKIIRDNKQGELRIYLKYSGDIPAIRGIKRVSRPGMRVYSGVDDIPVVQKGLGTSILSTNKGIMTDREAKEARVGGEVLCCVW